MKKGMHDWLNERRNKWLNGWLSERMNVWMMRGLYDWLNARRSKWLNGLLSESSFRKWKISLQITIRLRNNETINISLNG